MVLALGEKEYLLCEKEKNKGIFYAMGHLGLPCPFPQATQISV